MSTELLDFNELLAVKRLKGDPAADDFIRMVFANPERKQLLQQWMSQPCSLEQLTFLKTSFPGFRIIEESDQLPAWADTRLMNSGSEFFARNSELIMSLLGLLSLPYCYTAANGAMVLYLSELIRKQTTKRLFDTAIFVWEVMGPDAFHPDGLAFTEILKVRLMHAAIRYYTLSGGKWNDDWGLPINQEDMAGTNLSFSLIVLRGLKKMGVNASQQDEIAFMHLWNVIGFLTGLDEELIPKTPKDAESLDSAIAKRQFISSAHGMELTSSLVEHILRINKGKVKKDDILGLMRYLLENEVADKLGIVSPKISYYKLSLIKVFHYLKRTLRTRSTRKAYHTAYATFQKQKPA